MDVGFTGTQTGMTAAQKRTVARLLTKAKTFRHGDCVGADSDAHDIAKDAGAWVVLHPPLNKSKRAFKEADEVLDPKEYLDRNKDIVLACDLLIATPAEVDEQLRSGTWSTVRFARRMSREIVIVLPDGNAVPG